MRVTLVHNPTAGDGAFDRRELLDAARAAGHTVQYRPYRSPDLARALAEPCDVVVAAGGDGTVCRVARRMAGTNTPLTILALGTANNVATALGLARERPVGEFFAALPHAEARALTTPSATGPFGTRRFIESAGVGLLASLLDEPTPSDLDAARGDGATAGLVGLRRELPRARPLELRIETDLGIHEGAFRFAVAMNIASIGPGLELAPAADPSDGWLDLVLARPNDDAALERSLCDAIEARRATWHLETHRVRRMRLPWDPAHGHVDDGRWPRREHAAAPVELAFDVPPLQILVP